jgi:FtsP/CotA-like multicopper oxidase with cupredoxin domain
MLAERGLAVSNETIRRWVLKFGPVVARNLRRGRVAADDRWHLDEMVISIAGRHLYLWRAVDSEGEVLDMLVQPRRDKAAAARPLGWAAGYPPGAKVLAYKDLRAFRKNAETTEPTRTIKIRLTGNMERYVWTLNDARFSEAEPVRVRYGDRVRLTFVNETMMAHPMHLHGQFFEVENDQTDRKPRKDTIIVPPGQSVSVVLTAREIGAWPLHCHLLYHMAAGMMTAFVVEPPGTAESEVTPDGGKVSLSPKGGEINVSHFGHGGN